MNRKTWKTQWTIVLPQHFFLFFFLLFSFILMKNKKRISFWHTLHRTNIADSDCIEFSGWPHVTKNKKIKIGKKKTSFIWFYFNAFIQFLTSFRIFHGSRELQWRRLLLLLLLLTQCCRNSLDPFIHFEHIFIAIRPLCQNKRKNGRKVSSDC